MGGLSDEEKAQVLASAMQHIAPIAAKYELDKLGTQALVEAFQAGIRFTYREKLKHDIINDFAGSGENDG